MHARTRKSETRPQQVASAQRSALCRARVEAVDLAGGVAVVRDEGPVAAEDARRTTRLALPRGELVAAGDRVLVASDGRSEWVLAVVEHAAAPAIALAGGAAARLAEDGALEIVDGRGRLQLRWEAGRAELRAPDGDLLLEAPAGRVVVRAGLDVELSGGRDVAIDAGRSLSARGGEVGTPQLTLEAEATRVRGERLEVEAAVAEARIGRVSLAARQLATTVANVAHNVERWELRAQALVETTRTSLREAVELAEQRAGRVRTLVEGLHALFSRRNVQISDEDTSIDGRRVLLG